MGFSVLCGGYIPINYAGLLDSTIINLKDKFGEEETTLVFIGRDNNNFSRLIDEVQNRNYIYIYITKGSSVTTNNLNLGSDVPKPAFYTSLSYIDAKLEVYNSLNRLGKMTDSLRSIIFTTESGLTIEDYVESVITGINKEKNHPIHKILTVDVSSTEKIDRIADLINEVLSNPGNTDKYFPYNRIGGIDDKHYLSTLTIDKLINIYNKIII